MDASELRIGNFIQDGNSNIQKITPSLMVALIEKQITFGEPIPLTKEWAQKLGLNDWLIFPHPKFKGWILSEGNQGFQVYASFDDYEHGTGIFVQYAHQLQNLYFALTGEELEVKESIPA